MLAAIRHPFTQMFQVTKERGEGSEEEREHKGETVKR